jgi:hypothetical protein
MEPERSRSLCDRFVQKIAFHAIVDQGIMKRAMLSAVVNEGGNHEKLGNRAAAKVSSGKRRGEKADSTRLAPGAAERLLPPLAKVSKTITMWGDATIS